MKNKASGFFKQIVSLVWASSISKAKSIKGKLSANKARLIMFTLMKTKKSVLLGSISDKIHGILGHKEEDEDLQEQDLSKAIIPYMNGYGDDLEYDDDDKYPDLTHCLFEQEELELQAEAQGGSVIDMVRNSKEEGGENFSLEDEIDHVADLFITRFYKQMRLQKLLSFKRKQQMLENQ